MTVLQRAILLLIKTPLRPQFLVAALLTASLGHQGFSQEFVVGELERKKLPSARSYDLEFNDWNVEKFLGRIRQLGIRLPLNAQGQFSGWLWVQRSAGGWFDFTNYRVEAGVVSPLLEVDSWIFSRAKLRLGYGAGTWRIGTLRGEVGHVGQEDSLGMVQLSFTLPTHKDEANTGGQTASSARAKLDAEVKQANLAAVLQALDLPVEMESEVGDLTLQAAVGVEHLRELAAWDFQASFSLPRVQWFENSFRNLLVSAKVAQGAATVDARAYAEEGEIQAAAFWPELLAAARGKDFAAKYWPQSASIHLSKLRFDSLLLGLGLPLLSGVVDGDWQFALESENGKVGWSTGGNLSVEKLIAGAIRLGDLQIVGDKVAARQQFQGEIRLNRGQGVLRADLTVDMTTAGPELSDVQIESYELSGRLDDFLLTDTDFLELPQRASLRASGDFVSRGTPADWLEFAELRLANSPLQVSAQTFMVEQAVLQATDEQFRLPRLEITANRQRVIGSAVVRRDGQGEHQANLRLDNLAIGPWVEYYGIPSLQSLAGEVGLQLHLKKAAAQPNWATGWDGTIEGQVPDLRWQGRSAGELRFQGQLTPEQLFVQAVGNLWGGKFSWGTKIEPDQKNAVNNEAGSPQEPPEPRTESKFTLQNIDLKQLFTALHGEKRSTGYAGDFSVSGEFASHGGTLTAATFDLAVPRLTYQQQPILSQVSASGSFAAEQLNIDSLRGRIAGGRVNLRGGGSLRQTSTFAIDLRNAKLSQLVTLLNPDLAEELDGRLSFRGSLRVFPERRLVTASGSSVLQHGLLYGVPLQRVRGMLTAKYDFGSGQLAVSSRRLHGEVLGGDFKGAASLQGASRFVLDSNFSVASGRLEQLSESLGFEGVVGQGRFDASASLVSSDLASLDRLGGKLDVDFESGSPKNVPLLGDVAKLVPFQQLQSTQISGGLLRAQLGQGQARIQDFQVFSEAFFFAAKGSIGLVGGRLDMDALLQTGDGWQQQMGAQSLRMLAPLLLPQLAVITEVADLIRNRTVYVHIAGTTSRPVLQPRVIGTLGRAQVQNLVRGLVGFSAASLPTQKP